MLFSERSIWTMVHGIGLGGGALLGLAAALFYFYAARPSDGAGAPPGRTPGGRPRRSRAGTRYTRAPSSPP